MSLAEKRLHALELPGHRSFQVRLKVLSKFANRVVQLLSALIGPGHLDSEVADLTFLRGNLLGERLHALTSFVEPSSKLRGLGLQFRNAGFHLRQT